MNSNFNNKPPSFVFGHFYLFRILKIQPKFSIAAKLVLSSLFLVYFSTAHAALTDGLVAHWSFDDCTAKDNSGNGNDGTVQNNVSCVGGVSSKALHLQGGGSLDSSGGHISLPSINFASMPSYSVCLWVNEESMSYSHGESYISFGDHTGGMLTIAHFSNSLYFGVSEGSGAPSLILPYPSSDNNRFVHYCLVYNNGIVKGYKDQALQGSVKQTTQVGNTNAALGRHWWSYGSNTSTRFIGALDEVKIYNRALTDAEVTALYQQGTAPGPNDILGSFIDLNKSAIDFNLNKIALTFTKPLTAISSPDSPTPSILSDYFNQVSLVVNGKKLKNWSFKDIQKQLKTQNNYVLLDLPNSAKYQDQLIELQFINQKTVHVSAYLQAVTDQVVKFSPNAIVSSRQLSETKPTNAIVCVNKQGIKSPCNNFFDTTELPEIGSIQTETSVFRETLSHRLVDFDGVAPTTQINNTWANTAYGAAPQGDDGRIPLLLIHGWQGDNDLRNPAKLGLWENSELHYWQHFLDYYLATPALQAKYHVYLYHYPSYKHVTYNAKILNDMLYELGDKKPDSDLNIAMQQSGKGVVILAHSMGGLVARSAIEEYEAFGATGEKLRRLITLDTPHHGSPVSQPATWELEEFKPKLAQTLFKDPYTQGSSDLNWDNFDGLFGDADVNSNNQQRWDTSAINNQAFDKAYWDVCAASTLCSLWGTQNPWLSWMNSNFEAANNPYNNKYLLYAGWMIQAGGKDVNIVNNGLGFKLADSVLTEVAKIPSGGAEPVSSALWYSQGNYDDKLIRPFTLLGYDNESPFYSNCGNTGKTPWISEQWEGGNLSYQKINVISSGETICGNSILITKSPTLSTSSLLHPLAFQFRVFWDYGHENMINGAYPDGKKGGWDQYIIQPPYLDKSASANSAFPALPGTNKESVMRVKRNYVARATSYSNGSAFTQPNVNLYNPLKLEPLFNVLEKDLARTNDEEFIVQ